MDHSRRDYYIIQARNRYRTICRVRKWFSCFLLCYTQLLLKYDSCKSKGCCRGYSQAVVTKLLDRGTTQAIGIVSDTVHSSDGFASVRPNFQK